jgi:hypothetical protein
MELYIAEHFGFMFDLEEEEEEQNHGQTSSGIMILQLLERLWSLNYSPNPIADFFSYADTFPVELVDFMCLKNVCENRRRYHSRCHILLLMKEMMFPLS